MTLISVTESGSNKPIQVNPDSILFLSDSEEEGEKTRVYFDSEFYVTIDGDITTVAAMFTA